MRVILGTAFLEVRFGSQALKNQKAQALIYMDTKVHTTHY